MSCPMRSIVFNNYLDKLYADAHFDSVWFYRITSLRSKNERSNITHPSWRAKNERSNLFEKGDGRAKARHDVINLISHT